MTEFEPNDGQQTLIDATTGIHVVDAGAGTGKTFSITRRYANLLQQEELEPEDILLITFTNNAAAEVKERVVANCDYSMSALRDAPINTFHGYCHEFLLQHGFAAPTVLGIDDRITSSTRLLENEILEMDRFREFLSGFVDAHPEHHDQLRLLRDPTSLLGLIKQLAAKGVFPTEDGWFRNGEAYLDGDFEAFKTRFDEANEPNEGASGPTQSDLRKRLSGYDRERCLPPDAPTEFDLRGGYGQKQLDGSWAAKAFDEDRSDLKAFVHDIYFEYIEFALRRNYLNFAFLQMFAFVLLCEDHDLRESVQFEHVMVDEFQDTSEIQFKLALLLAGTDNVCVVGDWKQSIYGFQYASVDNIRRFERRLETYKAELNDDYDRIAYSIADVNQISLRENYRSTQSILEFSEHSLTLPATDSEKVDSSVREEITSLEATTERDQSVIESFTSETECDAVLDRVQEVVGNERYAVEGENGELQPPSYEDIAILTRKRRFGRELQTRATEFGIPVAYEGGVDLFSTDHAILALAWLRILEDEHSKRGWAVVLEEAGYTLDEIKHIFETKAYPEDFTAFRKQLTSMETIGAIARRIFDRYGFDDAYADALISVLQGTFDDTTGNRGDVVRFIERSLEAGATHEVSDSPGGDSVTVQTIHAAKGLEHPIVFIADVNNHSFPSSGGVGGDRICYADPIGLRQSKLYRDDHGRPHSYDNWRYRILSACLGSDYDEERRLLYVAITRAEHHVLFSAGTEPSAFFENLPLEPTKIDPEVSDVTARTTEQAQLQVTVPTPDGPIGQSPHSLMDDGVFEEVEDGMGMEFGTRVHDFAERYAEGEEIEPENDDERHVKQFIDSLPGELRPEENAYLPLEVEDKRVTVSGIIDLLHVSEGVVEIIDYKTDRGRHAESEYRKQLSVYYHVVRELFPNRDVSTSIYYTGTGNRVDVDPLTMNELESLVDVAAREEQLDSSEPSSIR